MLDLINDLPITTDATDSIRIGCEFSDGQIMGARNRSISQTGGLSKTLTLKLELESMLTTNIDRTAHHIKGKIAVVKYFKFLGIKLI